jgi:hypothetical protein
VPDDQPAKISLLRRIDLGAVIRPAAYKRGLLIFGVVGIWSLIGVVSAALAGDWFTVAVAALAVLVGGTGWCLLLRARRRIPATKDWMDSVSYECWSDKPTPD